MDCQGGGGGGGYRGGGRGGACQSDECRQFVLVTVVSVLGLCILSRSMYYCYYNHKGEPNNDNSVFINLIDHKNDQKNQCDIGPFQSGIWFGQYFQHGTWHGAHEYALSFDSQSRKVTGIGSDDVGVFTINGIYSNETNRLGLTKIYQAGTDNKSDNLGHQVIIQLTWNTLDHQFSGKWYVQTSAYHGEGAFLLTFIKQQ